MTTTRIQRAATRLARSRAAASGLVSLAGGATVVAVVIAATAAVSAGAIPAIATGILALGAMAMSEPFSLLPAAVDGARTGLPSARRLVDITERPIPVAEPATRRSLPEDSVVVLDGISMRYGPGLPLAVDGVSLRLEPGSRIGIEGPSGSGKSSLAAMLVRFRDFEAGSFTLGGVDVRELGGDDVRTQDRARLPGRSHLRDVDQGEPPARPEYRDRRGARRSRGRRAPPRLDRRRSPRDGTRSSASTARRSRAASAAASPSRVRSSRASRCSWSMSRPRRSTARRPPQSCTTSSMRARIARSW